MRISRIVVLAAAAAGVMAVPASPAPSHLTKVKPFTVTHGPVSLVYVDAAPMFSKAEDQIQIGGASVSKTAATRPTQSVTVRPIVGGSGKYVGAGGWCTTVHYANGNRAHTFHLTS